MDPRVREDDDSPINYKYRDFTQLIPKGELLERNVSRKMTRLHLYP